MEYTVESRHQERQPYVAVRVTVPMAEIGASMGPQFERLYGWLGRHGVAPAGEPWTRYLAVGADEVEYEIGAPVAAPVEATAEVIAGVMPACEVASTIHTGPYDHLVDAYAAVDAWLRDHGAQASGAMWEVYLTSPDSEPDPSRWRTLVCYPFAKG